MKQPSVKHDLWPTSHHLDPQRDGDQDQAWAKPGHRCFQLQFWYWMELGPGRRVIGYIPPHSPVTPPQTPHLPANSPQSTPDTRRKLHCPLHLMTLRSRFSHANVPDPPAPLRSWGCLGVVVWTTQLRCARSANLTTNPMGKRGDHSLAWSAEANTNNSQPFTNGDL